MITKDPNFPAGSLVLITNMVGAQRIGTVVKAVKGREKIRVSLGKYSSYSSVFKKDVRVITKEEDPELFI